MEGIPSALHMGVGHHSSMNWLNFYRPLSLFCFQWEGVRSHGKYSKTGFSDSAHKLYTVASLMAHQAPGLPLAGHAPFLRSTPTVCVCLAWFFHCVGVSCRHRIDSVTVRGVGSGPTAKPLLNLARYLAVLLAEKTCIFSVSSPFCLPPGPWRVVFEASTISWRDSTIQSSSTMPRLAGDSSPLGCSCLPSASYWLHSCWRYPFLLLWWGTLENLLPPLYCTFLGWHFTVF